MRLVDDDWGDEEALAAASLLPLCARATKLTIGVERLTFRAFGALGEAIAAGAMPRLTELTVGKCTPLSGAELRPILAGRRDAAALPRLRVLTFYGAAIEDDALSCLAATLADGGAPALTDLLLWSARAGPAGLVALADALRSGAAPALRLVDMSSGLIDAKESEAGGRRRSSAPPRPRPIAEDGEEGGDDGSRPAQGRAVGKGALDRMRRVCKERGLELQISANSSYRIS